MNNMPVSAFRVDPIIGFLRERIADDDFLARQGAILVDVDLSRSNAWDPQRLLRDGVAKLAIVDAYAAALVDTHRTGIPPAVLVGLRIAVVHLARVYANHPHFRSEWSA